MAKKKAKKVMQPMPVKPNVPKAKLPEPVMKAGPIRTNSTKKKRGLSEDQKLNAKGFGGIAGAVGAILAADAMMDKAKKQK